MKAYTTTLDASPSYYLRAWSRQWLFVKSYITGGILKESESITF